MNYLEENFLQLLSYLIMLIGAIITLVQFYYYVKSLKTKNWIETEGIVIESEIEISQNLTKEKYENHYRPKVIYKYEIDGSEYKSDRLFFGDRVYSPYKTNSEKTVKKYPVDKKVKVFVNPLEKSESVLNTKIRLANIFYIFFGVIMFVAGLYIYGNQDTILSILNHFK